MTFSIYCDVATCRVIIYIVLIQYKNSICQIFSVIQLIAAIKKQMFFSWFELKNVTFPISSLYSSCWIILHALSYSYTCNAIYCEITDTPVINYFYMHWHIQYIVILLTQELCCINVLFNNPLIKQILSKLWPFSTLSFPCGISCLPVETFSTTTFLVTIIWEGIRQSSIHLIWLGYAMLG